MAVSKGFNFIGYDLWFFIVAAIVSGMALATGDCRMEYLQTPAASAVPLTVKSIRPAISPDDSSPD